MTATSWPLTSDDVQGHLGVAPASLLDAGALSAAAAAATSWCNRHVVGAAEDVDDLDADRRLGAVMLAARWYARRTSVNGLVAFGELGASYVMRSDPDIAQLLGLSAPGVA